MTTTLILYTKQGCCLCEALETKLRQIEDMAIALEIRDIATNPTWFDRFQYEVPMLYWCDRVSEVSVNTDNPEQVEKPIPRPSPRATVADLKKLLQRYIR